MQAELFFLRSRVLFSVPIKSIITVSLGTLLFSCWGEIPTILSTESSIAAFMSTRGLFSVKSFDTVVFFGICHCPVMSFRSLYASSINSQMPVNVSFKSYEFSICSLKYVDFFQESGVLRTCLQ